MALPTSGLLGSPILSHFLGAAIILEWRSMATSLVLPVTIPPEMAVRAVGREPSRMLAPPSAPVCQLVTIIHFSSPTPTMPVVLGVTHLAEHHLAQASLPAITIPTPHGIPIMPVVLGHIRAGGLPHAHVCLLAIIILLRVGTRTTAVVLAASPPVVAHPAQACQPGISILTSTRIHTTAAALVPSQQAVPHPALLFQLDILTRFHLLPVAVFTPAGLVPSQLAVRLRARAPRLVTMFLDPRQAPCCRVMLVRIPQEGPQAASVYQPGTTIPTTFGTVFLAVVRARFQQVEPPLVHRVRPADGLLPWPVAATHVALVPFPRPALLDVARVVPDFSRAVLLVLAHRV